MPDTISDDDFNKAVQSAYESGQRISDEHYPEFVALSKAKGTTPQKLIDYLSNNKYQAPTPEQAAQFLTEVRRAGPNANIDRNLGFTGPPKAPDSLEGYRQAYDKNNIDPITGKVLGSPDQDLSKQSLSEQVLAFPGQIGSAITKAFTDPNAGISDETRNALGGNLSPGNLHDPILDSVNHLPANIADLGSRVLSAIGNVDETVGSPLAKLSEIDPMLPFAHGLPITEALTDAARLRGQFLPKVAEAEAAPLTAKTELSSDTVNSGARDVPQAANVNIHPDIEAAQNNVKAAEAKARVAQSPEEIQAAQQNIDEAQTALKKTTQKVEQTLADSVPVEVTNGKLAKAIGDAQDLKEEQAQGYADQRAERYARMANIPDDVQGKARQEARLQALSGEMDAPAFEPISEKFTDAEHNKLYQQINDTNFSEYTKVQAGTALRKLMDGQIPATSELQALAKTTPGSGVAEAALKQASKNLLWEDYLTQYHYAGMLSGVGSLEHNVLGHVAGSASNNVAKFISGLAGSALKPFSVAPEIAAESKFAIPSDLYTLRSFGDRMTGYAKVLANRNLYKDTYKAFKENQLKELDNQATWAGGAQLKNLPIVGKASQALTAAERLHTASYAFFGEAEKAANMYEGAMSMARKEGLTGDALRERADELVRKPPEELLNNSVRDANAVRFTGKGDLSEMLSDALKSPKPEQGLRRITRFGLQNIAPFAGIAEQKLLSRVRMIPILDRLDPYVREQWASGTEGKQMVLARYSMGASAVAIGSQIDVEKIFGKDLTEEVPFLGLMKATHNAINNYQKLTPKTPMSQQVAATESVIAAIGVFATEAQNETFIKSLSDFFTQTAHGDSKAARNYIATEAQSWMPMSALSREATKFIDPVKRDVSAPTKTETIINKIKATTPGLSQSLPKKILSVRELSAQQKNSPSPILTDDDLDKATQKTKEVSKEPITISDEDFQKLTTPHSNTVSDADMINHNARMTIEGLGYHVTDSGVRSRATQEKYYATTQGVAKPGTSPHEFDRAIDVRPHSGANPLEIKQALQQEGYEGVKIITKRHGTAPHWHVQWERAG